MKVRLSLFAVALIVVVNVYVLAGAAWNRSGEAEAVLELTERELALPYARGFRRENSGVALRIQRPKQDYDWLDNDKLRELDIDPEAFIRRSHDPGRSVVRTVHVALEFDGPAFESLLVTRREEVEAKIRAGEGNESHRERLRQSVTAMERSESRLAVVDAALDPAALRDRYPNRNRYAVVEARLSLHAVSASPDDAAQPRARITRLLPAQIYVSRGFHAALEKATESGRRNYGKPPRYQVEVRWGRRLEPWITDVTPLSDD